jgi:hypothetical protein
MANRKKCQECERMVGGGVTHSENCSKYGLVMLRENLTFKCKKCPDNRKVGFKDGELLSHHKNCRKYLIFKKAVVLRGL